MIASKQKIRPCGIWCVMGILYYNIGKQTVTFVWHWICIDYTHFSLFLLCCLPDLSCSLCTSSPKATRLHGQIQQADSAGKFMQIVASPEHRKQDTILYTAQKYRHQIKGGVASRQQQITEQLCCRCLPFPYLNFCFLDLFYYSCAKCDATRAITILSLSGRNHVPFL